jgi:hypothetical protein
MHTLSNCSCSLRCINSGGVVAWRVGVSSPSINRVNQEHEDYQTVIASYVPDPPHLLHRANVRMVQCYSYLNQDNTKRMHFIVSFERFPVLSHGQDLNLLVYK